MADPLTPRSDIHLLGLAVVGGARARAAFRPLLAQHPAVEVTGAVDHDLSAARAWLRGAGSGRAHARLEDLLHDDAVNAVVVASAPAERCEHARAALAEGRHVLYLEPWPSPDAVAELADLAVERGLVLAAAAPRTADGALVRAANVADTAWGPGARAARLLTCTAAVPARSAAEEATWVAAVAQALAPMVTVAAWWLGPATEVSAEIGPAGRAAGAHAIFTHEAGRSVHHVRPGAGAAASETYEVMGPCAAVRVVGTQTGADLWPTFAGVVTRADGVPVPDAGSHSASAAAEALDAFVVSALTGGGSLPDVAEARTVQGVVDAAFVASGEGMRLAVPRAHGVCLTRPPRRTAG